MSSEITLKALAITADQGLAQRLQADLAGLKAPALELRMAGDEAAAGPVLGRGGLDLVLLDLALEPAGGLDLFHRVTALVGGAALVLLGSPDQEELGWRAVRAGAQDFLCPRETGAAALRRACRHAWERQRIHNALAPAPEPRPEPAAGIAPASASTPEPLPAPPQPPADRLLAEDQAAGERLVLVDDEAGVADVTERGLTRLGYRVHTWVRPAEAWEWMQGHPQDFDLLITDLTMPDMGGLELVQRVSGLRPGLPIILWTGYQDLLRLSGGAPPEVHEVLAKPVTVAELGQAVRRVLDSA